jgi:hypothetical protein
MYLSLFLTNFINFYYIIIIICNNIALYDELYESDKDVEKISKEFKKLIGDYENLKLKYNEYCNDLAEMEVKFDTNSQEKTKNRVVIKFATTDSAVELSNELKQVDNEIVS